MAQSATWQWSLSAGCGCLGIGGAIPRRLAKEGCAGCGAIGEGSAIGCAGRGVQRGSLKFTPAEGATGHAGVPKRFSARPDTGSTSPRSGGSTPVGCGSWWSGCGCCGIGGASSKGPVGSSCGGDGGPLSREVLASSSICSPSSPMTIMGACFLSSAVSRMAVKTRFVSVRISSGVPLSLQASCLA